MYRTKSSISSLKLIVFLSLMLSACGFKPVYSKAEPELANELASVQIEPIEGRAGQIIRNNLKDLLNPGTAYSEPLYSLRIKLDREVNELGIRDDLRVTRYDIIYLAEYDLVSIESGQLVDRGAARIKSSYNRTASEFATYVANEDANEKAVAELAEDIKAKLIIYFSKHSR